MLAKRFKFLQPTRPLRELRLLGAIEQQPKASQRLLAKHVLLGPTMVHRYISEFQRQGLISIAGESPRTVEYRLTASGLQRLEELLFEASREVVQFYGLVKHEFSRRLRHHIEEGARRVVLFGAAETAELVYAASTDCDLDVIGIVDNDTERQGLPIGTLVVGPPSQIEQLRPDTVLITSFGHASEICASLRHLRRSIRLEVV